MKKIPESLGQSFLKALSEKFLVHFKLNYFLLFFTCIFISMGIVSASPVDVQQQVKKITGTVTDQKGVPLPGVTVIVKGTTTGIVTSSDGKYQLSVPADAKTLMFSFVGMKSQEFVIGNSTTINVTLAEETTDLEEVVAVGYGVQKKN